MNRSIQMVVILAALLAPALAARAAIVFGPNGYGGFNAYELVTAPQQNWANAKTASQIAFPGSGIVPASAHIGHLATIRNAAENATILTVNVGAGDPWIGLTDQAGDAPGAFEGGNQTGFPVPANGSTPVAGQRGFGWAWVTGEPLIFHNWNGAGEPNGGAGESHVQLTGAGLWNDLSGGSVRNYIREWDLNISASNVPMGEWFSQTFKRAGNAQITNLATADDAVMNGVLQGSGTVPSVNYADIPGNPGSTGRFDGGDFSPFGLTGGDDEDFTVVSTGFMQIGTAGNYQFVNNTDDGSRLRIDLNQDGVFGPGEDVIIDNVLAGDHDAFSAILAFQPGQYKIEHLWYERGGGAEGDLGVSFNSGPFLLFGDPRSDGSTAFFQSGIYVTAEALIPEPATAMTGLLGLALLGWRRRRREQRMMN